MVLAGHPNHGGKTARGCFLTAEQMPQGFGPCTIHLKRTSRFSHNSKYDATFSANQARRGGDHNFTANGYVLQ
jgi:hypothetical protein